MATITEAVSAEGRVRSMKCDYRDEECVRVGHDCAYCNVVDMHLCDTCKKTYPECDGKNVKIGCDIDTYPNTRQNKDNIFYCDGYVKREKKKTNADRIRSFSDEELAEFIGILAEGNEDCAKCPAVSYKFWCKTCKEGILEWLQSEVE